MTTLNRFGGILPMHWKCILEVIVIHFLFDELLLILGFGIGESIACKLRLVLNTKFMSTNFVQQIIEFLKSPKMKDCIAFINYYLAKFC